MSDRQLSVMTPIWSQGLMDPGPRLKSGALRASSLGGRRERCLMDLGPRLKPGALNALGECPCHRWFYARPMSMRLGILGGGQLARMLMLAAHPLGIRCRAFDSDAGACAGQVGELHVGSFEDGAALARFADGLDVVTYEFENVPTSALEAMERAGVPIRPKPIALATGQDRLHEKTLFQKLGVAVAPFAAASTAEEAAEAVARVGLPCVMKTRRLGYDGKGQVVLKKGGGETQDVRGAGAQGFAGLGGVAVTVEAFVPFTREVSVVAVRGMDGAFDAWPLVQNRHEQGILRLSVAPARDAAGLEAEARRAARAIMEHLEYVGVLAVEFFVTRDDEGRETLLANEMAPRVHNSGHWTIEGATTSQFENHVRACVRLPLGATGMRAGAPFAAMVNFIGDWPAPAKVLGVAGTHVHLYGKEPRPGRKVGHVNVVAGSEAELRARVGAVESMIG